jgi:hypothetical protein
LPLVLCTPRPLAFTWARPGRFAPSSRQRTSPHGLPRTAHGSARRSNLIATLWPLPRRLCGPASHLRPTDAGHRPVNARLATPSCGAPPRCTGGPVDCPSSRARSMHVEAPRVYVGAPGKIRTVVTSTDVSARRAADSARIRTKVESDCNAMAPPAEATRPGEPLATNRRRPTTRQRTACNAKLRHATPVHRRPSRSPRCVVPWKSRRTGSSWRAREDSNFRPSDS